MDIQELMNYLLPAVVIAVFATIGWRYLRHGSVAGAVLGGRIEKTLGEVEFSQTAGISRVLRVYVVEGAERDRFVGLAIAERALLSGSIEPMRLSGAQAHALGDLLLEASKAAG